jgi:hypothetical protein
MSSYPGSPKLIKGAFVEFSDRFIASIPNVIMFQYNPESITRKLQPWDNGGEGKNNAAMESATAQPFDPEETFDLNLELDGADILGDPEARPDFATTAISGLAARIAAIELLLYPQVDSTALGLLGSAVMALGGAAGAAAVNNSGGGMASLATGAAITAGAAAGSQLLGNKVTTMPVPRGTVPTVFFVWGPGRVIPVRLTSFSVDEHAYLPTLYPLRATVSVGLKVIQPRNIPCMKKEADKKAVVAYNLYQQQKRGFGAANLSVSTESIIKMI